MQISVRVACSGLPMEPLSGVDAEQQAEESLDAKNSSSPSSPKHIANPVVYKLVRVEGDGRFVPATDDEVMEVEDLVDDEKGELSSVTDTGQVEGSKTNEVLSHAKSNFDGAEGMPQLANGQVDAEKLSARLEYIGVMLEKVKKEERLRLCCGSLPNHSDDRIVDSQQSDQPDRSGQGKHHGENSSQGTVPRLLPRVNNSSSNRLETSEMRLKVSSGLVIGGSSSSITGSSLKPDFSKIKGEICLDNLSIKELHETFRATFGRETSVKDKLWLKRRIAMGLTNSCDVSTTTFVIKDNILIKKKVSEEANCGMQQSKDEAVNNSCKDSPIISFTEKLGDRQIVSGKRMRKPAGEYESVNKSHHTEVTEQTAAKRVRKPTRRYIEELSEAENRECSGRSELTVKSAGHDQSSVRPCARPFHDIGLNGTSFVTRQDSLGGSGVQVPYISRLRRGRPRKNFMSLMNYHPNGSMAAKLVKKALGVCISRQDSKKVDRDWKARLPSKQLEQLANSEREEIPDSCVGDHLQSVETENPGSSGNTSDNNVTTATETTTKGGERRKHHRAWTLGEVVKLVEGVSKYGAGRWSEIKRVSFAPYSYRTSVDLKDKWRNLLRASFALALADNGVRNLRKHAAVPIPTPILLRVRELAEKDLQTHPASDPDLSSGKLVGSSGREAHDARSGYL